MEKKNSIFSALSPSPPPTPFQKEQAPPPPSGVRSENDARVAGLEAAVKSLQSEIAALKQSVFRPPAPPPPPVTLPHPELLSRLERAESGLANIGKGLEACMAQAKGLETHVSGSDADLRSRLERSESGLADIRKGLEACMAQAKGLETHVSGSDADLRSRLERSEAALTGLTAGLESCQALAKRLEAYISRNDVESVAFSVSETVAEFKVMRQKLSEYGEAFSAAEKECRKAVGLARGYAKDVSEKLVADRFDEHLRDSVSNLSPRIAELETMLHAGLADLSGRLLSDEVLYGKIIAESGSNLKKSVEPDITELKGKLKVLGEKMAWFADEQNIVTERRLRALEARSSAFDAISARLDTLEKEKEADIKEG